MRQGHFWRKAEKTVLGPVCSGNYCPLEQEDLAA